ncbi:probable carboxylesterase 13 [Punica granatum]|uniref:Probable carboxylesterase 13 n=1 Tax=Punica granatum TaxID=22663 RepID=A0A6P8D8N8_PUNGR|nr:probable carboxylesterase 13 [Punica granatum]
MEEGFENIAYDYSPILRIHKNGFIKWFMGTDTIPPSMDPAKPVPSKDVANSTEPTISARLYLPNNLPSSSSKLPVLVYFHGVGFVIQTTMFLNYHHYLNALAVEARVVIGSVEYRREPQYHLPAAYDDSQATIKWFGAHSGGLGQEEWLNNHANLRKMYLGGDRAGPNIAHHKGLLLGVGFFLPPTFIGSER